MKELKATLKKKGGGGLIKFIPKDGTLLVRFLQEPEEFVMYEDCWDPTSKRSFPYVEGLVEGKDFQRKSTVFLTSALDVERDQVIPLQLKQSVLNALVIRFERHGTLLDRDYEIARYGEGLDTTYDVTPEAPQRRNVKKYELLDLEHILEQAYNDAMSGGSGTSGGDDDDDDERPRKSRGSAKAAPRRNRREPEPEEDEDDEEDSEDEAGGEEDYWTEEEMQEMEWAELKSYAREQGVTLRTKKRSELIAAIMDETGQEE